MGDISERINVETVGNEDLPLLVKGDVVKTCPKDWVGTDREGWDYWHVSHSARRNQIGLYQVPLEKIIEPNGVPISWSLTQELPSKIKGFRSNSLDRYVMDHIINPHDCQEIKGKEVSYSDIFHNKAINY